MVECMIRIRDHSQFWTTDALPVSQCVANGKGIRDGSKYLYSLDKNLVTAGLTSRLNNGTPFWNRLNEMTSRSLERGLRSLCLEKLRWITYLRSKIRVTDYENISEISTTRCNNCVFILHNGFTLHVSGGSLTHDQEYICCIWPQVSRLT